MSKKLVMKSKLFSIFSLIFLFYPYNFLHSQENVLDQIQEQLFSNNEEIFLGSDPKNKLELENENNISNTQDKSCIINDKSFEKQTNLELSYSKRAGRLLFLQGYDFFKCKLNNTFIQTGAVQDDYILGVGDEIVLILQGGVNKSEALKVNREGNLIFEFMNPVSAAGRKFGAVKDEMKTFLKSSLIETQAFISLSSVRQINVTVSGEVNLPGSFNSSAFSSVIDFLNLAEGIKKTGTLRNVKVFQNEKVYTIDLYNLIFGTNLNTKFQLMDGANIVVPPIGNTVGVTGTVAKPGLYELSFINQVSVESLLEIVGGYSYPGLHSLSIQAYRNDGNTKFYDKLSLKTTLENGDLIFSFPKIQTIEDSITIKGAVNFETKLPFVNFNSISKLLNNSNLLKSGAYKYALVIKRFNEIEQDFEFSTVNIWDIIKKNKDYKLNKSDEILVLSKSDLNFFVNKDIVDILQGNRKNNNVYECKDAFENLSLYINSLGSEGRLKYYTLSKILGEMLTKQNFKKTNNSKVINNQINTCPLIFKREPKIIIELLNSIVLIRGMISKPGVYLKSKNSSLKNLLIFAGYKKGNVVVSPDLKAIDILIDTVKMDGAVRFPSEFKISNELKISKIINNTNVFKKNAYNLFGIIKNYSSQNENLKPFNPLSIINKETDFLLYPGDEIYIFSKDEIQIYLDLFLNEEIKNAASIQNTEDDKNSKLDEKSEEVIKSDKPLNFSDQSLDIPNNLKTTKINELVNTDVTVMQNDNLSVNLLENKNSYDNTTLSEISNSNKENETANINIMSNQTTIPKDYNLKIFELIKSHIVSVKGEVVNPSFFPIGYPLKIESIIQYVNGLKQDADFENVEINNINYENNYSRNVFPGAKVFVPSIFLKSNNIILSGAFKNLREVGYKENISLRSIIYNKNIFEKDAYIYFGLIKRKDNINNQDFYLTFSPSKVLSLDEDKKLEPGDEIQIFKKTEIDDLINEYVGNEPTIFSELSLDKKIINLSKTPSLEEIIKRSIIKIKGEVVEPKEYLLTNNYNALELINIAGGFTTLANTASLKVISPVLSENGTIILEEYAIDIEDFASKSIKIEPGSVLRVNKIDSELSLGSVNISGQVFQPGNYQILENETIFSLIKRAGGLKDNAFIDGMVFSRLEEKEREEKSLTRLRRELDKAIAVAVETQSNASQIDPGAIIALRELALAASDFEPIGRLVGDYNNLEILKNTKVISGDKVIIPRRPTSISVVGEVMTPGSILWNNRYNASDYIELSAGFTDLADKKRVFVISPNGRAKRQSGLWASNNITKPGSVIVVPRKIELSSTLGKIEAVTSVVYQLTLTLAGIDNLLSN